MAIVRPATIDSGSNGFPGLPNSLQYLASGEVTSNLGSKERVLSHPGITYQLPREAAFDLESQIIEAYFRRNNQQGERMTADDLMGKTLEVNMPICMSRLFLALQKQLSLTTAELLKVYKKTIDEILTKLVGKGNYTLNVFVHFPTLKETEEFFDQHADMRATCIPIEELRETPKWLHVRKQLDILIAKHPQEWDLLLSRDCEARKKRLEMKWDGKKDEKPTPAVVYNEEEQKAYYADLCCDWLTCMVTKDDRLGILFTNDAHPDFIYNFAKAHVSEMEMPEGCGFHEFFHFPIKKIEVKSLENADACLRVVRLEGSLTKPVSAGNKAVLFPQQKQYRRSIEVSPDRMSTSPPNSSGFLSDGSSSLSSMSDEEQREVAELLNRSMRSFASTTGNS